ncbi:hypothetical protein RM549_12695 [Salegentibacter sp. F188]|uniref:Uncharacterized protein n=1 Tax=Autumnicola patrickiae TaxID=3075591 RepID=A0ABU3E3T5_9FLAO|nr:hypothetical protein [Salegentibacter sp. F188]MDT0690650.1 hypothetical protein [Salegentibacter sp. F188]
MKLQQKIGFLSLAGVLAAGYYFYTKLYIQEQQRQEIKDVAEELAYAWRPKLGLTIDQVHGFENLIIEYTIKKNEVLSSSLNHEKQIRQLKAIQKEEHLKMQKLLSEDQFNTYLTVNRNLTKKS